MTLLEALKQGDTKAIGYFTDLHRFKYGLTYNRIKDLYERKTGRTDFETHMRILDGGYE